MILDDTRGTMVPMDAEPENGDYTGEDGLLYCGACHTPKEAYFPERRFSGVTATHPNANAGERNGKSGNRKNGRGSMKLRWNG